MHILSNVTWYRSHFTMSNVFRPNHSDTPPERWLNFIHLQHPQACCLRTAAAFLIWLSLFPPSFSVRISGCLLRGVLRKLILVLALYAMLGLSQSAPAPALIRGDSLPDSSAQELSVKRPIMGIVVNTETPQSTRLTGARSQMTNYEETLIHFSHNK